MRVFKRGDFYWIDYFVNGKRIRKSVSKRKKDAEKALAKIQVDMMYNKYAIPKNEKIKFDVFAKQYLQRYVLLNHKSYRSTLSRLKTLVSFFKDCCLNEISSLHIEQYKEWRMTAKVRDGKLISTTTINREFEVLNHMINTAIQWGYLANRPFQKIKKFREESIERILTLEEIKKLVAGATPPLKSIILVALNTGMRLGEILNLTFDHVNMDGGSIYIQKTKTGKARRIPLNESLYELFSYLFLKRKGRKFVFENPKTKKPIVCIKRSFKTLLKKKGILNVRFHDLRHTFSTYSLLNGCDIFHLSQILGHTNLTTTMRYLSVKTEGLQKVVNSFVVKDPKSSPRSLYVLKTGSQK